jgi:hypothetical protein
MALDKDYNRLKLNGSHNLQAFGQNGFRIVSNQQVDGEFVAIMALVDSTISFGIPVGMDADDGTIDLKAGMTIYGKFTTVTALSGRAIAYTVTEG